MTVTEKLTAKEIHSDYNENYMKVRKLLDEDSKNDPENEPYLSKYKAKELLMSMKQTLMIQTATNNPFEGNRLDAMLGSIMLNIGVIDIETEDLTSGANVLTEAALFLEPYALKQEVIVPIVNVYNHLGILWSQRGEPTKAKTYLLQAKEAYENFKCTLLMPLAMEYLMSYPGEKQLPFMVLEKAHTHTLYYLAQVYGTLKDNLKSAIYCHVTLRRQLQHQDYEPIDWALNAATLSQFFAEQKGFHQSRHHLAAASTILKRYEATLAAVDSNEEVHLAELERFKHRSADVAHCWAKYCNMLMRASKDRLMDDSEDLSVAITDMSNISLEDNENICGGDLNKLIFPDLDVSEFESKVTDKYLLTFEDTRLVFLNSQSWLNKAKEYYQLETLASDYVRLTQDNSCAYCFLSFFEEDDERRAKMQKKRIVMLEEVVKAINPTYYLSQCRQLWYEIGDIYSNILCIKLDKLNKTKEKPSPHALRKINMLSDKSIEFFEHFLNSIKDNKGVMPLLLELDLIKPVIMSYAYIGRNSMKRISMDKHVQISYVKKSLESYQAVVDICKADERAAAMRKEEYSVCLEMLELLPLKLKKMQALLG